MSAVTKAVRAVRELRVRSYRRWGAPLLPAATWVSDKSPLHRNSESRLGHAEHVTGFGPPSRPAQAGPELRFRVLLPGGVMSCGTPVRSHTSRVSVCRHVRVPCARGVQTHGSAITVAPLVKNTVRSVKAFWAI